jgi:hypothetical protein
MSENRGLTTIGSCGVPQFMRVIVTSAGAGFGAGACADAAKANVPAQAPAASVISIRFIDFLPWGRRMLASLPATRKHADANCIARGQ